MKFTKKTRTAFLVTMLIMALGSHVAAAPTYVPVSPSTLLDIQGLTEQSSTQKLPIGTRIVVGERVFRYAQAGGTLVAGKACISPTAASDHIDLVPSATASTGEYNISLTNGDSTAITANMYDEGYLFGNDGTNEGEIYRIASHTTCATGAVCTFTLSDPLLSDVAAADTNEFGLMKNPWDGVTHSATEERLLAGISLIDVTSGYYFWIQTWGVALVLRHDTAADGEPLTLGSNTAGAMQQFGWTSTWTTAANIAGNQAVSHPFAGVQGEYRPVWLMVAP